MSVQNILNPTNGKIDEQFLDDGNVYGFVQNPMTADLECSTYHFNNAGRVNTTELNTDNIAILPGSLQTSIQVKDTLTIETAKKIVFETDANIEAGLGGLVKLKGTLFELETLPNGSGAPTANVIGYDPITHQIQYQPDGGGATPALSAVLAVGNSAGGSDILMNTNDIQDVSTLYTGFIQHNPTIGTTLSVGDLTTTNTTINGIGIGLNTANDINISATGVGSDVRVSIAGNNRMLMNLAGTEIYNPSASGSVSIIGSSSDPALILRTNSGTNRTVLLDMFMSRNTGAFPANGDVITAIRFKGDDYLGNEQEYAKIETTATNVGTAGAPTNIDGTLSFSCITNDVYNTYMTLNGSTQAINMGKKVLLGGNDIEGINRIGLTSPSASVGLNGQSLISGGNGSLPGDTGAYWNYKMTGTYSGVQSTISVSDTGFTDILGNPAISLVQGSFVLSPINKYKITVCGNAIGVNDIMELYIGCGNGATVVSGATFGTSPYYYYANNMSHAGAYYTSYTITDTVSMSSAPFTVGSTANIYLYARCVSGSHTISTNAYNCSIEPVYV